MSVRKCWPPAIVMWPAASYAHSRAADRSAPSPVTASTRPPDATSRPLASRRVPACCTLAPGTAAAASTPADLAAQPRRVGIAGGGHDDGDGEVTAPGGRLAGEQLGDRARQPGEDSLRLGIAEARVELDDLRAGGGERQPRVEQAAVRRAAAGHLRDGGLRDARDHGVDQVRRRPRQRRVRPHPAGVRTDVAVVDPLEVLRR